MMTRKDFQLAASQVREIPNLAQRLQTAQQYAALFMLSNPKFNLGKFLDACCV
ncbi:MAG: hypothetical protein ACKOD7_02205 [Polynucleobacter victoriensis]